MRQRKYSFLMGVCAATLAFFLVSGAASAESNAGLPSVVSMNVCTDQLAMMIAAPGQLLSVSGQARDQGLSALHEEANAYPVNGGLAEDVLQLDPDIVLTGNFSLHGTTALLRRLGFTVAEFAPDFTFSAVRRDILRIGTLLNREERAAELVAEFDAELAAVTSDAATCDPVARPLMLSFGANGITSGGGTLPNSVMEAAGFANLANEAGLTGAAFFPLETLVASSPDLILTATPHGGPPALSERIMHHPALAALDDRVEPGLIPSSLWTCGGPFTVEAVRRLRAAREELLQCAKPVGATQ